MYLLLYRFLFKEKYEKILHNKGRAQETKRGT